MRKAKDINEEFRQLVIDEAEKIGSVNRLCQAAGVPQASVSAWLSGAQSSLSWSVVSRICNHCGVTIVERSTSDRKPGRKRTVS